MKLPTFYLLQVALFGFALILFPSKADAQQNPPTAPQLRIQLPTTTFFNIRSTVRVPDGGTMNLGGVSRSAAASNSFGTPIVGNVPGIGRSFRNQSVNGFGSASQAGVHVRIISNREIDEALTAEAYRREMASASIDPDGSPAVQRMADFLSQNMGRR